jgi:enamine deaminase RidA (YjgF/YER057c/UK114 family)
VIRAALRRVEQKLPDRSTFDAPGNHLHARRAGVPQLQAVKVGNTIYVAGTIGVDVTTGELAGPTIQEQTGQGSWYQLPWWPSQTDRRA